MTTDEYRALLKETARGKEKFNKFNNIEDPSITQAISLGTRLSDWIKMVNAGRTPENAIRLTSPSTRVGIPIDKPSIYSPELIKERLNTALSQTPADMSAILLSYAPLPATIPVDDESFIKAARLIDRQYQSAARYKSLNNWRSHYVARAKKDVRGLHFLKTNKIGAKELADLSQLPSDKLPAVKDALVKVCYNNARSSLEFCASELNSAIGKNAVPSFYQRYIRGAEKIWNDFFVIPPQARRRDVQWHGMSATVPFNTPLIPKFVSYLQVNIEDEFQWEGWGLKMNFGTFPNGPLLKFRPGVVPHVNALGGNEIVMDSNQPIEEYASQWTIRHEFGHVLGLPDCYHEFFDTNLNAYVNYQLDITDLMCSRAGNMNERIFKELKGAYEK